jgi:hypothetical protein
VTTASRPVGTAGLRLPRRSLLIFGAGLGLGLAGCSADSPGPSPAPPPVSPTPDPLPGTVDGAALESSLASVAAWISSTFVEDLDSSDQRLLDFLQQAHTQHADALSASDPLAIPGPPPTPIPTTTGSPSPSAGTTPDTRVQPPIDVEDDLDDAFAALATMEADIADGHRRLALDPQADQDQQRQQLSLLWGSLAAAGFSYADACQRRRDPGDALSGVQRVVVDLPEPVTVVQDLLEQVYAAIFGYQTAIAALSGDRGDHARARLGSLRDLRDQLSGQLADDDQDVPAPHAAYELPVQPTSSSKAGRLVGLLESRLQPYLGQWLATAEGSDRGDAVDNLISAAGEAQAWTAAVSVWPGWPIAD